MSSTKYIGISLSFLSIRLSTLILLLISQISVAEESSIFDKYGIPNELPKYGISSLSHGDHVVEHVQKETTVNGEKSISNFYLVQTTDIKGNIDLRIKYFENALNENSEEPSLSQDGGTTESIEYMTKTEYKLRLYAESYDRSSVTVEDISDGEAIIRFKYSKYGLPQDVAYFRFMTVALYVKDKTPIKMVLTNSSPFTYGKYQIEDYEQEVIFDYLRNGKIYVKSKTIVGKGTLKGEAAELQVKIEPVAFFDDKTGVEVKNAERLAEVSDPRIREEKVEVDSVFPLMGDLVRRQGIDIPLPYGFSVAYRNQEMDLGFDTFNLGLGALGFQNLDKDFDPSKSFATVQAESFSLRGDVYILPFWNVYGLIGKIKVRADIDAEYTAETMNGIRQDLNALAPGIGDELCSQLSEQGLPLCSPGRLGVPLKLNYDMIGVGTTLAIGYKEFFATLNTTYTKTRLEGSSSWGDGLLVVQPMLGYQFVDYRAQFLIGAEYQGIDSNLSGNLGYVDVLQGDFEYDVGIKLNQWAYLVGVNKQFGKHYNVTALYNKGESRDAVTVSLGYRF